MCVVEVQMFTYKAELGQSVIECLGNLAGFVAAVTLARPSTASSVAPVDSLAEEQESSMHSTGVPCVKCLWTISL